LMTLALTSSWARVLGCVVLLTGLDMGAEAGLPPVAHGRARVYDEAPEAEGLRALQLVRERVDGLPPRRGHRRGEVDEIAAVGERVPDAGAPPGDAERAGGGGVERRRRPLARVLEAALDGAAAELAAPRRRQGQSARDRHVRAQLVGSPGHRPRQSCL